MIHEQRRQPKMRLRFGEDTEAFRREFLDWLEANRPSQEEMAADPARSSAHVPPWAASWAKRLFDAGWLMPGFPPERGGRNAGTIEQMVYQEEFARAGVPRTTNPQGLSIIAPTLLDVGSEEQIREYALPIMRGDVAACLGMSEPGAGSDLASLQTRAVIDGDDFVVSGRKIWTSGAHHADVCFCFVRTDPKAEKKHRGISVLLIPMDTPGINCRPLPSLRGLDDADFNEVLFEDVRVPRANLVGEAGAGWSLANNALAHERGMLWIQHAAALDAVLEGLLVQIKALGPVDEAAADELVSLYMDAQAVRCMGYQGVSKLAGGKASPEHSILKLVGSESVQRLNRVGSELIGEEVLDLAQIAPIHETFRMSWGMRYLFSFSGTIAGGTSEIQRNIVAERVLGLPR
jgi:alkylation response protein AidB-like acyl-CoA dehydrogenase